jgi:hypothetical protein
MGTDAHVFLEVMIDGKWHCHSIPDTSRNYTLFAIMADVRNYDKLDVIVQPKGLPEDLSTVVQKYANYWNDSSHSHSWFDYAEIQILYEQCHKHGIYSIFDIEYEWLGYLFGNRWNSIESAQMFNGIQDVRMVFWFDS